MRFPALALTVTAVLVTFVPIAEGASPCPLSTVSPSVTICTPTSGNTVTSPFTVAAGTTDTAHPVTAMKVYLDYVAVYSISAAQLSTTLTAAAGSHHLTVSAWDSSGAVFKSSLTFTVSTSGSVTASPTSLTFGNQALNTPSVPMNVTLANSTASAVTVNAPGITGDFLISSNSCGSSVAANSQCAIGVEFQPTATGTRTGTLTISDSPDSASPHSIALSGTGGTSAFCTPSTVSPSVTICTPTNGATVSSPFPVTAVTTDTAHPVTAMTIYLDNIAVYTIQAAQLSTTLSASGGSHNLTINAWDSSGAVFKGTSLITVTAQPLSATPTTLAFGDEAVGITSAPRSVQLKNGTGGTLTLTITPSGPYSESDNCNGSLNAGATCTATVTFTPTAVGTQNGSLSISYNAAGSPQAVALTGAGATVANIAVTPANPTIAISSARQFTATATYSDNTTADVTTLATWTSSSTAVATVSNSAPTQGLATGVATGSTTIQAAYAGVNGSTTLNVVPFAGVLTFHNDNLRTGVNATETVLTPANVNVSKFGKVASYSVDGRIYAQPLYVPGVTINGAVHNVVYAVTEADSVYAFDADAVASGPLWKRNFTNSGAGITTIASTDTGGSNVSPQIGISSTPVIDTSTGTLYCVAATNENGTYHWRLHALDIGTGADKFGGSVDVNAPGFIPLYQLQRPGLLLVNGTNPRLYFAFGSNGDHNTWHGWVFAYDASTLMQMGVYNATPSGNGGGIWMGAGGLGADASGNVYFETGNGTNDVSTGGANLSDSFIKLNSSAQRLDYFTPYNHNNLDCCDLDLASGGPVLLPDQSGTYPHIMIGGGKTAVLYVLNRDNLGQFNSAQNNIIQTLSGALGGGLYSQPSFWNGRMYISADSTTLKAFSISNGLLSTTPVMQTANSFTFPGGNLSISSNGATDGIVWAENMNSGSAILYAYDAANLATMLWNSAQNSTRDTLGAGEKFMAPTVANGKVYVGTMSKFIVYGLLP